MPIDQRFQQVYTDEHARLAGYLRKNLPPHEVDDILQDCWLALYDRLQQGPVEQPRALVYQIARHKIADHYRRAHTRKTTDLEHAPEPDAPDALSEIERRQLADALNEGLLKLPEKHRRVVVDTIVKGVQFKDLADESDISMGTLLSQKYYAVRKLRDFLQSIYDAYFMNE